MSAEEDMSILSQVLTEEPVDEVADLHDLSMPLDALTTPIKTFPVADTNSNSEDMTYFNTTLIPQMDGQVEDLNSVDEFEGPSAQNLYQGEYCSTHLRAWEKDTEIMKSGRDQLEEQRELDRRPQDIKLKVSRRNLNVGKSAAINILESNSKAKAKIVPSRQCLIGK